MSALHPDDYSVVTIELWINNASLETVDGMLEHLADKYKLLPYENGPDNPQECIVKRSVVTKYPEEVK